MFGNPVGFEDSVFDEFRRLHQEMDEIFSDWSWPAGLEVGIRSVPRGTFPAVNVGASPEKVDVYVFCPGIDRDKLDVSLEQNLLTVSGQRSPAAGDQTRFYRQERFNGEFRKALNLPDDLEPGAVQARYRDGVLHVSVRRRESARPRQIAVQ
jgi:HSP20 family protein